MRPATATIPIYEIIFFRRLARFGTNKHLIEKKIGGKIQILCKLYNSG